jgi:uncharacterized protein (TIGR03663 family)
MSRPLRIVGFAALLALAVALRLSRLDLAPLHHDEGVNGWFTLALHWWGRYAYLPSDYHGPLLYYVGALAFDLLGASEFSLRLGPALAGALVLPALLPLRRHLPAGGLPVASLLLAVAPALVYFSRSAIHEIYLVLFTAALAAALARLASRPGRGWAAACGAAAAGCFVTKETAVITAASLAAGAVCAAPAWLLALPRGERGARARSLAQELLRAVPVGLLVFAVLMLAFYSSFFTHAAGVRDFFAAFDWWIEYGTSGRNQGKPFGYFWELMAVSEGGCRLLLLPAAALAVLRRDPAGLALAGWGLAAFAVYSALPYKTPWCVLQIDLPAFLLIGWAAGSCLALAREVRRPALRAAGWLGVAAALLPAPGLLARSLEDVRERYDDPGRPYVYHHTQRDYFTMLQDLFGAADTAPDADGRGPRVVNSEAGDPVRFYLHTRGWAPERTRLLENPAPPVEWLGWAQIVISSPRHLEEVRRRVAQTGAAWHEQAYPTRPGVATTVFYRKSLWDRYQAVGGRTVSPWPRPAVRWRQTPAPPPDA